MRLVRTKGRGAREAARLIAAMEARGGAELEKVLPAVRRIVESVRRGGDKAVLAFAKKFDGLETAKIPRVTKTEMAAAWNATGEPMRLALEKCAAQVRGFAGRQMPKEWDFSPVKGLTVGQRVVALDAVGCYVPSGRHPLPSTLLMTAVPAQVAGVRRIVVMSAKPARETLAAAHMLGITEFYRLGGAQGIAALAYGTETIARVDKIAGPGNLYVTAAKQVVAHDCAIDMLAGPTEIVVSSDKARAELIAADLVAQAEHDPEALAVFITTQEMLAERVVAEAMRQSAGNDVARESLKNKGVAIVAATIAEARELTNRLAPEHLTVDDAEDLKWVRNAGSVFVGRYSAQPLGDYISGPNHTLPTGGLARVRGGLSVNDFVKLITVQEYSARGVEALGPHAVRLAKAEGLPGHAAAIEMRMKR